MQLDLRERPFTDRGSRLLVMADEEGAGGTVDASGICDALWIARAEYETKPAEATVLSELRVLTAGGSVAAVRSARPDRILFSDGTALVFADPETLVLAGSGARAVWRTPDGRRHSAVLDGCLALTGARPAASTGGRALLDRAAHHWVQWFAAMPTVRADLVPMAAMAWWTLAVNTVAVEHARGRSGVVPSKYGYVGIWNWDACFHALALRHADPELARDQIRILLDHQLDDGQLPDAVHDRGVLSHTSDLPRSDAIRLAQHVGQSLPQGAPSQAPDPVVPVTKPPLTAWAVWQIHQVAPDPGFLAEIYEPLVRAQRWWLTVSDPDGDGLAEYLHPYSSGLDDSPVWDLGGRAEPPDLNAYLAHQFDRLGDIAAELGRDRDAEAWRERAAAHTHLLIRRRWDSGAGCFVTVSRGGRVPARTPLELMPLFTGRLPREIADRLVARLRSPSYWGERPVPSVAFDDPTFDPEAMWRGPVWLNINYLLIDALRRSGHHDTADDLTERSTAMVAKSGGLYEYWNPLTGRRADRATTGFGWSSALFLDLAQRF